MQNMDGFSQALLAVFGTYLIVIVYIRLFSKVIRFHQLRRHSRLERMDDVEPQDDLSECRSNTIAGGLFILGFGLIILYYFFGNRQYQPPLHDS